MHKMYALFVGVFASSLNEKMSPELNTSKGFRTENNVLYKELFERFLNSKLQLNGLPRFNSRK